MWDVSGKNIKESSITDIEDLKTKRKTTTKSRPFVVELSTFNNGAFLTNSEIDSQLRQISLKFPKDSSYILKVTGHLADDIKMFNQQVLYIHSKTPAHLIIMVQVSFERLMTLADLEESCFTKSRIYPNVKYYLVKGEEKRCIDEFSQTFVALKSFDGLRFVVSVSVSSPLPDMSSILAFLRVQRGFIRFVEISVERSPTEILDSINRTQHPSIPSEMLKKQKVTHGNTYAPDMEVYEVLENIQSFSAGTISVEDFFPISMGSVLEPFLPMFGYGKYQIRPSPHCGYACCLVNSEKFFSTSLNRIIDFEQFYNNIQPLLPALLKGDIGFMTMAKVGSVFKDSIRPGVKLPFNLITYLTDKDKARDLQEFIENLQFIVVHNHLDLVTIDMVKRCDCAALKKGSVAEGGNVLFATCTGCI
eukprot:TRINITY_DN5859_c0_g1_i1.p1 TRINITY_DN5859_c0_g1~~TRINITY_DN5859_c0_g1_i1.p1  ORF type:complete len:487 (-),score=64.89 TRINITY_DN5859_c0_g1_i1:83-1336(-)